MAQYKLNKAFGLIEPSATSKNKMLSEIYAGLSASAKTTKVKANNSHLRAAAPMAAAITAILGLSALAYLALSDGDLTTRDIDEVSASRENEFCLSFENGEMKVPAGFEQETFTHHGSSQKATESLRIFSPDDIIIIKSGDVEELIFDVKGGEDGKRYLLDTVQREDEFGEFYLETVYERSGVYLETEYNPETDEVEITEIGERELSEIHSPSVMYVTIPRDWQYKQVIVHGAYDVALVDCDNIGFLILGETEYTEHEVANIYLNNCAFGGALITEALQLRNVYVDNCEFIDYHRFGITDKSPGLVLTMRDGEAVVTDTTMFTFRGTVSGNGFITVKDCEFMYIYKYTDDQARAQGLDTSRYDKVEYINCSAPKEAIDSEEYIVIETYEQYLDWQEATKRLYHSFEYSVVSAEMKPYEAPETINFCGETFLISEAENIIYDENGEKISFAAFNGGFIDYTLNDDGELVIGLLGFNNDYSNAKAVKVGDVIGGATVTRANTGFDFYGYGSEPAFTENDIILEGEIVLSGSLLLIRDDDFFGGDVLVYIAPDNAFRMSVIGEAGDYEIPEETYALFEESDTVNVKATFSFIRMYETSRATGASACVLESFEVAE